MRMLLLSSCLFVGGIASAANDLPGGGIDPAALSRHVRMLASDEFEGRAPATAGEQRTVDYLVEQFRLAGEPGGHGDARRRAGGRGRDRGGDGGHGGTLRVSGDSTVPPGLLIYQNSFCNTQHKLC